MTDISLDASPIPNEPDQPPQHEQHARAASTSASASPPTHLPPSWSLDDFEFGRQIGDGRFGTVYLARERASGYKVAVKAVRKDEAVRLDMRHQLEREVRLQTYASRHAHVLKVLAYFWDAKFVYMVMEYCDGGDLSGYCSANAHSMHLTSSGAAASASPLSSSNNVTNLQSRLANRQLVDESTIACWARQLLEAVGFMHERRLLHRDIKPENIMLRKGRVKLGDFTWCVSLGQSPPYDRRRTICGTLDYLSPELISHVPYDTTLDVWSVGVVVYELLVGHPPFEHPRPVDTCLCIQRGEFSIPHGIMSALAEDFLKTAIVVEPSQRPSCRDLLRHPWIETAPPTPMSSKSRKRAASSARAGGGAASSTSPPLAAAVNEDDVSRALELSGIGADESATMLTPSHHQQQPQHHHPHSDDSSSASRSTALPNLSS